MPAGVELRVSEATGIETYDLLGEINALRLKRLLFARRLSSSSADFLRFERRLVGLQDNIIVAVDVVNAEVIVIRSRQDLAESWCQLVHAESHGNTPSITAESTFEFIEDAIVLV